MRIEIIAVGRLKSGAIHELVKEYSSRIHWPLDILEIESKHKDPKSAQKDELEKLANRLSPHAYKIALDERGKGFRSIEFSRTIQRLQDSGQGQIQFIIGGADGLSDNVRNRADALISFGHQTWPHMLVRVLVLEQIYRAQQIIAGHPYHRE